MSLSADKPPKQFWIYTIAEQHKDHDEPYVGVSRIFASKEQAEKECDEEEKMMKQSIKEDEDIDLDDYILMDYEVQKLEILDSKLQKLDRISEEQWEKNKEMMGVLTKAILYDSESEGDGL